MALLGVEMNKTGYMPQNSARQKEREIYICWLGYKYLGII